MNFNKVAPIRTPRATATSPPALVQRHARSVGSSRQEQPRLQGLRITTSISNLGVA